MLKANELNMMNSFVDSLAEVIDTKYMTGPENASLAIKKIA